MAKYLTSLGGNSLDYFLLSIDYKAVKPQRRKANEGVRIANLYTETRMNSKDEFRQGTNIFLQPVRGLGET